MVFSCCNSMVIFLVYIHFNVCELKFLVSCTFPKRHNIFKSYIFFSRNSYLESNIFFNCTKKIEELKVSRNKFELYQLIHSQEQVRDEIKDMEIKIFLHSVFCHTIYYLIDFSKNMVPSDVSSIAVNLSDECMVWMQHT